MFERRDSVEGVIKRLGALEKDILKFGEQRLEAKVKQEEARKEYDELRAKAKALGIRADLLLDD